ncbi:MAG: molybdopterin-containing oxidoreductase family protein [Promethearchaeota archaeon]
MSVVERKNFFCSICDAGCGLIAVIKSGRVIRIVPDKSHPVSKGYCCPKGLALHEVTYDPDRILTPLKYESNRWIQISWDRAFEEIGTKLSSIRKEYGPDAIATHMGTNGGHCFSHSMYWKGFNDAIGTCNCFTAGSVDTNNKFVVQYLMYGNATIMPIPDLLKTNFLILIGTNPSQTNLSLAKCPNIMKMIRDITGRGKVILVDPRRNETAKYFDARPELNFKHFYIWPTTDQWFLLALIKEIIENNLIDEDFIEENTTGFEDLKKIIKKFSIDFAALQTGITKETIKNIAREFFQTEKSVIYARLGTCQTLYPLVNAWAIEVLHAITGHLDRPGCAVFGRGPFKVPKLARMLGLGTYNTVRSRIGGHPEVMGAFPISILSKEIKTPGHGQVKALIESGGNLALTAPNSNELIHALKELEIIINIDFYLNETATIAAEVSKVPLNYFLPATTALERENVHITHLNYNVIPHVEYHDAVIPPLAGGPKPEWEIFLKLTDSMGLVPFGKRYFGIMRKTLKLFNKDLDPDVLLHLLSIIGNFKERKFPLISSGYITFNTIKKRRLLVWDSHEYGVLKDFILTKDKRIQLMPGEIREKLRQLFKKQDMGNPVHVSGLKKNEFLLIGRRHRKSMNSWMHNIPSLWRDGRYPRALVNTRDAAVLGLEDGDLVRLSNENGEIKVPIEITDDILEHVISYPHGWGHHINGLNHAKKHPGENYNVLTSNENIETLSGMPLLNGIKVKLEKI